MTSIDLTAFQADYHNPELRAADVAERYGLAEGSLAEFAQKSGIQTRKALGIKARPRRKKDEVRIKNYEGEISHSSFLIHPSHFPSGCRPCCPGWVDCQRHKGREQPACEIFSYLDENPGLIDWEPTHGGSVALMAALYLLEGE